MPDRVKEKLVELCEDVILSCKSSLCVDCEHNGIDYPNCMGVHFADHLIASGVTLANQVASSSKYLASSEWIPVTERLPEKNTSVLAYLESGRCVLFYDRYGFCEIDEYGQDRAVDDVTHWMPLPQPPKGE